ncbi:unnamed protein product [Amoebophrya sp. A25]|nr:unnamed protein product [Amoebophrya sp. A25]|eukprot:GSA25T00009576001.1
MFGLSGGSQSRSTGALLFVAVLGLGCVPTSTIAVKLKKAGNPPNPVGFLEARDDGGGAPAAGAPLEDDLETGGGPHPPEAAPEPEGANPAGGAGDEGAAQTPTASPAQEAERRATCCSRWKKNLCKVLLGVSAIQVLTPIAWEFGNPFLQHRRAIEPLDPATDVQHTGIDQGCPVGTCRFYPGDLSGNSDEATFVKQEAQEGSSIYCLRREFNLPCEEIARNGADLRNPALLCLADERQCGRFVPEVNQSDVKKFLSEIDGMSYDAMSSHASEQEMCMNLRPDRTTRSSKSNGGGTSSAGDEGSSSSSARTLAAQEIGSPQFQKCVVQLHVDVALGDAESATLFYPSAPPAGAACERGAFVDCNIKVLQVRNIQREMLRVMDSRNHRYDGSSSVAMIAPPKRNEFDNDQQSPFAWRGYPRMWPEGLSSIYKEAFLNLGGPNNLLPWRTLKGDYNSHLVQEGTWVYRGILIRNLPGPKGITAPAMDVANVEAYLRAHYPVSSYLVWERPRHTTSLAGVAICYMLNRPPSAASWKAPDMLDNIIPKEFCSAAPFNWADAYDPPKRDTDLPLMYNIEIPEGLTEREQQRVAKKGGGFLHWLKTGWLWAGYEHQVLTSPGSLFKIKKVELGRTKVWDYFGKGEVAKAAASKEAEGTKVEEAGDFHAIVTLELVRYGDAPEDWTKAVEPSRKVVEEEADALHEEHLRQPQGHEGREATVIG